jgi:hypothetical protein
MSALGSFGSILACQQHARLGGNLGNAGCPVLPVEGIDLDVIQAPKPEPRIMRYELTGFERAAIRSFLPNKPHVIPRIDDRRVARGIFLGLALRCSPATGSRCSSSLASFQRRRPPGEHRCGAAPRHQSGPSMAHRGSQNSFTAAATPLEMMLRRSGELILSSSSRLMIEPASSKTAGIRVVLNTTSSSWL